MNNKGTLDRFIENERKSRLVTLVSTILLVLCALTILFLFFENVKIKDRNKAISDSLKIVNENLELKEISLNRGIKELKDKDSIIKLLQNTTLESKETELENKLKILENSKHKFKIYIHYMPDYKKTSDSIKKLLSKNNKYYIATPEKINRIYFTPQIRYFNAEDSAEAEKLQIWLKLNLNLNLEVKRIKMVAQKKQIEIWYGKIPTDDKR